MELDSRLDVPIENRREQGLRTRGLRTRIAGCSAAVAFLVLVQVIHFGILAQIAPKPSVDRHNCTNTCFDTVLRGPYEKPPGVYHHVTFNFTPQSLKIWTLTVVAIILVYESIQYVVRLVTHGKIRWSMLLLLLAVVHSHYYSWWMCFNYWNDDFYIYWNHQLIFSATELASTALVVAMLDKTVPTSPRKLLGIGTIAVAHLIAGGLDQAISNLFFHQGRLHQVVRDSVFMSSDFVNLAGAAFELRTLSLESGKDRSCFSVLLLLKREVILAFCLSALVLLSLPHIDPG